MAEQTTAFTGPNRRIGSIEHVGRDGFIVEAADPQDPGFIGGKRLFANFDELLRFLADHLQVYKGKGAAYGIKPEGYVHPDPTRKEDGGNGVRIAAQPQPEAAAPGGA